MAYPRVHTLAAVALTASLAGCVAGDADANIVILRNQALTTSCSAGADPEAAFYSSGIIDTTSSAGYLFSPIIQNFAMDVEGTSLRIAFVHGARIDIHFADEAREEALAGQDGLTRFQVPLSGSIDAGGTIGLIFEIVPDELFPSLVNGDLLLVDVRIFGEMGGDGFESANFRYPVEVCVGCLQNDLGPCSSLPIDFVAAGHPCGVLQDQGAQCCDDPQGEAVCPAMGTMTP
jgi:hypothetical protein